jgi:hypothetical protein
MLLRAGGAAPRTIPVPAGSGKLPIIIDLSALLLADRCDLLPEIETAFSIRIPGTAALAIVGMEDDWPEASPAVIHAGRKFLAATATAVRVVDHLPAGAVSLDTEDNPFELAPGLIAAVCGAAVAAGIMPRDIAAMFSTERSAEVAAPAALALAPWSLLRLATAGALEPIANALPTYLTSTDRQSLQETLERIERSIEVRNRLTRLREHVAERLAGEAWTTVPHATTARSSKAHRLPPHVLGIADVIEAAKADANALVWIEDRALSRARPPLSTSILEVLDHLRERGIIDEAQHRAVGGRLRDIGYGFMPVPAAHVAQDVGLARIADGVLVETPELARWRRWFAAEVDRLQHAGHAPEPDASGRIAGEPRHVLSMLSAVRNVLAHVWAEPGASIEDKRARSKWVWTCLRFESTTALPWSAASPSARLALVAMVLFHAADVPLMAMLGIDDLPEASWQGYIDWLTSSVLDPRSALDPALGDCFARHVASLLAAQLGRPADDTDTAEDAQLRAYLITRYRRFLDLFPAPWRERIFSHCDLAAKMGIVSVLTVEVGGVDIAAEDITAAIADAARALFDATPSVVPLALPDGEQGQLTLSRPDGAMIEAELTVGGVTAHLDPAVVALSLPDAAVRSAALAAIPQILDLPAAELVNALAHIAEPHLLADRVGRLKAAQVLEFRRHLNRMNARLAEEGKFEISDLDLPAPEAIARYLRLPDPFRAELGTWLEEIAHGLSSDLGAKLAARRCGAVPFELAAVAVVDADDVPTDGASAEAAFQVEITSPAHGLLRLRSLVAQGTPPEVVAALVKVVLDRLDRQAGLMAALLRKGARQLGRSESWSRLHRHVAFALLWVWADRLASTFAAQPIDMVAMIRVVDQTAPAELTHLLDRTRFPAWFHDFAVDVDEATLQGAFAAAALSVLSGGLPPEPLMTRLLSAFGHSSGDAWYPKFHIAASRQPSPAGLWIATDPVAAVHAAGGPRSVPAAFTVRDPDEYVRALIAEPVKPEQPFLVVGLLSFLDLSTVSPETAEAVIRHIEEVQANNVALGSDPGFRRSRGIKAAALGRIGARQALEQDLTTAARASRSGVDAAIGYAVFGPGDTHGKALTILLEMALAYVRHSPEVPADRVKTLGALAQTIVAAWPASVRGVIAFLDRTVEMLPVELSVHIWPALLALRARQ